MNVIDRVRKLKGRSLTTEQLIDYSEWWIINKIESLQKENNELRERLARYEKEDNRMKKGWRPEEWEKITKQDCVDAYNPHYGIGYERGADAMHKADVDWLIQRIVHDDRGYVFNMNSKEWLKFIKR